MALTAFGIDLYYRGIEREQQELERRAWAEERSQRETDRQVRVAQLYLQIAEARRFDDEPGNRAVAHTVEILARHGMTLAGMDLAGVDLSGRFLQGVDLRGADLARANLSRTNLCGADLSNADLSNANMTDAWLNNSRIDDTNFRGVATLNSERLSGACAYGNGPRDLATDYNPIICFPGSFQHERAPRTYAAVPGTSRCARSFWSIGQTNSASSGD
ncbi:MAG: pentapeptide repeat-containing protein [Pseudomonadota bacterium]